MRKFLSISLAIGAISLTSGCGASSDPASEAPAKLQTGKYEITYNGAVMGMNVPNKGGPGGTPRSGCITSGMISGWPKALLQDAMPSNGYCGMHNAKRTGNALTGEYVCEADQERAPGGKFKLAYTGEMTDTTTRLDTQMTMDIEVTPEMLERDPKAAEALQQAGQAMKATTIVIEAKRLGDC